MQNYVGKQIDRYRVIEKLGTGGMAVVYKAFDTRLEREVALKLIRTDEIPASQHERLMKRFEREAKAQARFSHPNIVPVHDYGEVDGSPYIVMAYVPGGTLKQKTGKPINVQTALDWLIPIADALAYAHELGVVHRDIKPSNILFDQKGRPMLADFGVAKVLESNEATLTGTGMGVGTPEYMAPEQWQGKVSEASDQYALGVVLYELITGQKPFTADTPAAIILMQANDPLIAPSKLVRDIPEGLEKVLYMALASRPEDRYENMASFKKALMYLTDHKTEKASEIERDKEWMPEKPTIPFVDSEGLTQDVHSQKVIKEQQPKKRRWLLWAGLSLVGVALIVIIIIVLLVGNNNNKSILDLFPEDANEEVIDPDNSPRDTKISRPTQTCSPTTEPTQTNTLTIMFTETPLGPFEYIIQYGDTMASIALLYGVTVESIMEINNLTTSTVYEGQPLLIPRIDSTNTTMVTETKIPSELIEYTVQEGDSCPTIAMMFNIPVQSIILNNNLSSDCILYVGQYLQLPQPTATVSP